MENADATQKLTDKEISLAGQSFLQTMILNGGNNFSLVSTDKGSGAKMYLSVFRPLPPSGYFYLGHVAVQGWPPSCPSSCMVVQPVNDDPNNPCLKQATGFVKIWDNAGSGSSKPDYSFYQPICGTDGYVSIGTILFTGTNDQTPIASNYPGLMLVRYDLTKNEPVNSSLIWDDVGSGSTYNASLFSLPYSNYFICSTGPEGQAPTGSYPDILNTSLRAGPR